MSQIKTGVSQPCWFAASLLGHIIIWRHPYLHFISKSMPITDIGARGRALRFRTNDLDTTLQKVARWLFWVTFEVRKTFSGWLFHILYVTCVKKSFFGNIVIFLSFCKNYICCWKYIQNWFYAARYYHENVFVTSKVLESISKSQEPFLRISCLIKWSTPANKVDNEKERERREKEERERERKKMSFKFLLSQKSGFIRTFIILSSNSWLAKSFSR